LLAFVADATPARLLMPITRTRRVAVLKTFAARCASLRADFAAQRTRRHAHDAERAATSDVTRKAPLRAARYAAALFYHMKRVPCAVLPMR